MATLSRRALVSGGTALMLTPRGAEAQPPAKRRRIGYLSAGSRGAYSATFLQELSALGWTEGRNLTVDSRWAGGKHERLPELAEELVGLKPDTIVSITTPAIRAAVSATSSIPIVFSMVADPVGSGFVASLARPGGNVTGLTFVPDFGFFAKQLELLTKIVPSVARVAILWVPTNPVHARIVDATRAAAKRLGVAVVSRPVQTVDELEQAFTGLTTGKRSAALVIADLLFFAHLRRLAELAATAQVPVMYGATEYTEAGGLASYAQDLNDLQRRVARYVDRILRGTAPAALPVERPSRFELVVNLKTAKALGLTIPQSLLLRADRVIE